MSLTRTALADMSVGGKRVDYAMRLAVADVGNVLLSFMAQKKVLRGQNQ